MKKYIISYLREIITKALTHYKTHLMECHSKTRWKKFSNVSLGKTSTTQHLKPILSRRVSMKPLNLELKTNSHI